MPTIGDKLTAIYDIKNKIREAIVNKGGSLHEKSALSDYPQAIYDLPVVSAPADTYNYHPNPAWWDIKTIIENDEVPEGYVAVAAFLLVDSPYKTSLDVFDAYKTSDGMFYSSAAEHVWDTTKDKDSGEGYKTRYVIAYVKTDSNRWVGKMLCATTWNDGIFYSTPIGCLGMVWNCPVFVTLYSPVTYLPVSSTTTRTYGDYFYFESSAEADGRVTYYYPITLTNYSWKTIQFINVTNKGKLVISDCKKAFSATSYGIPYSLRQLAPLYELSVVYKELLADAVAKMSNKYLRLYCNDSYWLAVKAVDDTAESLRNMQGYWFGVGLRNLEIHVADTFIYANTTELTTNFPYKSYLGGLQTCVYDSSNTYYFNGGNYPLLGKKLTLVIEKNTVPLDKVNFYPLVGWNNKASVVKYIPRLFVLYPVDNYTVNSENNCTLGIIRWDIVNKTDTTPQVHLFPAYQLNGMPASQLNKFIMDYLQNRTGMALYQMYVTASQSEKLSSTTKRIIAQRNWTLVVFS